MDWLQNQVINFSIVFRKEFLKIDQICILLSDLLQIFQHKKQVHIVQVLTELPP